MALTPAEKQARYRARQSGKIAPVAKPTRLAARAKSATLPTRVGALQPKPSKSKRAREPARPAKKTSKSAAGEPLDVSNPKAIAAATVDQLRETLKQLSDTDGAQPREISAVATALTAATRLLARLDGTLEITPTMLVRSPAWEELSTGISEALRPWPDAAAAVVEVLSRAEAGS